MVARLACLQSSPAAVSRPMGPNFGRKALDAFVDSAEPAWCSRARDAHIRRRRCAATDRAVHLRTARDGARCLTSGFEPSTCPRDFTRRLPWRAIVSITTWRTRKLSGQELCPDSERRRRSRDRHAVVLSGRDAPEKPSAVDGAHPIATVPDRSRN